MHKEKLEKYHFKKEEPQERQFDIFDLAEYYKKHAESSSKAHSHSFYQIMWFTKAEGKHFIDFEAYEIKDDMLFFIAKNQIHYFDKNSSHQGYLMHFNESFLLNNQSDINFFLNYSIFNNTLCPYFEITPELKETISLYFDQIKKEAKLSGEFGNSAILSNLLKAFLLGIEREKKRTHLKKNHSINLRFLTFRELIEKNYKKGWTVTEYADSMAISTKTLNKIVKAENNTTASQFISDRIILEAKRQLTHTNIYVNEIAYDLGFKDPYYFTKFFKKKVNCTPLAFRKSIS